MGQAGRWGRSYTGWWGRQAGGVGLTLVGGGAGRQAGGLDLTLVGGAGRLVRSPLDFPHAQTPQEPNL